MKSYLRSSTVILVCSIDPLAAHIVQFATTVWKGLTITVPGLVNVLLKGTIDSSSCLSSPRLFSVCMCWPFAVSIYRRLKNLKISIWKAMLKTPASIALIIYTFISMWFVGGLRGFHLYLISTNQTTYENFRYSYDRRSNPHNKGVVDNFKEVFFSPIPPSKNDFRAMIPRETPMPPRSAVGGFMSPNVGKANDEIEMGRKGVWAMAEQGDGKMVITMKGFMLTITGH